jgi:hypothetical protein
MRTFIASALLTLALANSGFAQQATQSKDTLSFGKIPDYLRKVDTPPVYNNVVRKPADPINPAKGTSVSVKVPLYRLNVDGSSNSYNGIYILSIVDQADIKSMSILKDKEADEQFGAKGKNGVILITLNKDVQLVSTQELLRKFNIKKKDTRLPVFINRMLTYNSSDLGFKLDKIKAVNVETEPETGFKYINIIPINKANIHGNEIRIRGNAMAAAKI